MTSLRVGVIGCGSIGLRHARNLIAMGHEVVAYDCMAIPWESERLIWRDSISAMLEHQPQAVLICTPAATHAEVARDLLDFTYQGPLFVEKPLALSVEDCEVFRSWPHVTTMVGYMLRCHPKAQAIKLLFGESAYAGRFDCDTDMSAWIGKDYGSLIFESSHELDLALWLGAPPLVAATVVDGDVRLRFKEGRFGSDWHVQTANTPGRYYRSWNIDAESDKGADVQFWSADELGTSMYRDELAHFLACVEKNEPTITPFADGIRVVQVCEDAMKMAKVQA